MNAQSASTDARCSAISVGGIRTPNSHQLMGRFSPALDRAVEGLPAALTWRPSLRWTVAMFGVLVFCVAQLHGEVRFLYFQF